MYYRKTLGEIMPRLPAQVPTYRRHKPTNQAVCTVRLANGQRKDLYLGPWNSAPSKSEYGRVVALVGANGGIYPSAVEDLSVNESLVLYTRFINGYYVDPDGRPSRSVENIKAVLGYLKRLFGPTPLADFGPPQLKAIRSLMVDEGKARRTVNKAAVLVRQFFRWCVSEQLVHPSVLESLRAVPALAPGRSGAAEGTPREPADPAAVATTLPHLPPAARAVVHLLRLTGARPSEMLALRPCDVDRSRGVWSFTLPAHKTAWKGKARVIYFGPEAQTILAPWLEGVGPEEYAFSPRRSEELRIADRSEKRRTPRWQAEAWEEERNAHMVEVRWRFTAADARVRLRRLYPTAGDGRGHPGGRATDATLREPGGTGTPPLPGGGTDRAR